VSERRIRAVVIGGGTGAPVSIRALLSLGAETSAVVAMADDGGSTGMLREHSGVLPPGDIRKCLIAMAADPQSHWSLAFARRFSYANDHSLGNLVLTALSEASGSFPAAVTLCEQLLQARGHVYPSTLVSVQLDGVSHDGRRHQGQAALTTADCALASVTLRPSSPAAYPPALEVIRQADLIVLGPGSLFTSIIPNLLVPGVIEAIRCSLARTVFLCSLADMQGETWGMTALEHVDALLQHGMYGLLDFVVVHAPKEPAAAKGSSTAVFERISDDLLRQMGSDAAPTACKPTSLVANANIIRRVMIDDAFYRHLGAYGIHVIAADLIDPLRPTWHDVGALAGVLRGIMELCPSPLK